MIEEAFESGAAGNLADFLPILNCFPEGYEKRIKKLAKRTDAFQQSLIDEHRSRKESKNTMIDHLLSLQDSQPDYPSLRTDVTLEWVMSNLLNHPSSHKKIKDELDAQIGQQHLIEKSDLSKLNYLQSIISKTLRLYPAAPMLVLYYSSDGCTIGRYDLPRGMILLSNAWSIRRDHMLWDDVESFRSERSENSEGESYKLMPFGRGRRSCLEIGLAKPVVGLTLGLLIHMFDRERHSKEEVDMAEAKGLSMPKVVPSEAICEARPILSDVLSETVHHY